LDLSSCFHPFPYENLLFCRAIQSRSAIDSIYFEQRLISAFDPADKGNASVVARIRQDPCKSGSPWYSNLTDRFFIAMLFIDDPMPICGTLAGRVADRWHAPFA
jgi:hypothetical protein